jgi:hypothetical protein
MLGSQRIVIVFVCCVRPFDCTEAARHGRDGPILKKKASVFTEAFDDLVGVAGFEQFV